MFYVEFGIYLAVMLGIGFYSMKKTKTHADFLIGSRTLGPLTSAISAGASDMSSWLLLGLPGAVFAFGLVEGFWIALGLTIGAYLNWLIVAGRIRSLSEKFNAITLPSFIAKRFDDESGLLKIVSTIVILFFFTLYVASGLKGGTLLFAHAFGASEQIALIITTVVVVSYTFLGGYIAVCWTDLIQGLLMLTALVFCALIGWIAIHGSVTDIIIANPHAFSFTTGTLTAASSLAWGFGYFGQPHILARFFGIRSIKDVRSARRIGITWMILSLVLACAIGLIGIGYNAVHPLPGLVGEGGNSERIFLALTTALFHPVFAGFVLAAVLAAVMSTADSQLLVLTSSLTEDIPFIAKLPDARKKLVSRLGVVGFALLAFIIAATDRGSILNMVGYAWGGFGAAFAPLVLLSVLWKGITKWGAFAGMITGSATIFIVKNYISVPGEYFYELLPGFFVALFFIIIVSLFTKKPSDETLNALAETQKEVREANIN
ncbi:MAG TPA: sodium/proline symporter PutP [Treponemataceae bacterium]|nr:sodium/proline symporter PutP [Treponemataceae bacterium]